MKTKIIFEEGFDDLPPRDQAQIRSLLHFAAALDKSIAIDVEADKGIVSVWKNDPDGESGVMVASIEKGSLCL